MSGEIDRATPVLTRDQGFALLGYLLRLGTIARAEESDAHAMLNRALGPEPEVYLAAATRILLSATPESVDLAGIIGPAEAAPAQMREFAVEWAFGATTCIEARDEAHAREKCLALDHAALLRHAADNLCEKLDVIDVRLGDE